MDFINPAKPLRSRKTARPTRKQHYNGWLDPNDINYDAPFLQDYFNALPSDVNQAWKAWTDLHSISKDAFRKELRQEYKIETCGTIQFASYADRKTVIMTPLEKKMRISLAGTIGSDCQAEHKWLIRLFLLKARTSEKYAKDLTNSQLEEDLVSGYTHQHAQDDHARNCASMVACLELEMLLAGGIRSDRYESVQKFVPCEEAVAAVLAKFLGCDNDQVRVQTTGHDDVYIIVFRDVTFIMNSEDCGISQCENWHIACGDRISRVRRDHLGPYRDSPLLRFVSITYVVLSTVLALYLPMDGKTGDDTVFEKLKTSTEILAFLLFTVFGIVKLFSDDEKVIRTYLTGKVRFSSVTNYAEFLFKKGRNSLARLAMSNHWDGNVSRENACYMRSECSGVLFGEAMEEDLSGKAAYYKVNMYIVDCISGTWYLCESRAGMGGHFERSKDISSDKIDFVYNEETAESGLRSFLWLA